MDFMPKNILKGRSSDGTSFRFEEWDFATLTTIEGIGWFIMFVMLMLFTSIAAPLITFICVVYFNGMSRLLNLISILIACYVLYDCTQGWFVSTVLSIFISENAANLVVMSNIAALLISSVLFVFAPLIMRLISRPLDDVKEEDYDHLGDDTKSKTIHDLYVNTAFYITFIVVLMIIGFMVGNSTVNNHKGWLAQNTSIKDAKAKEDALQKKIDADTKEYYEQHPK